MDSYYIPEASSHRIRRYIVRQINSCGGKPRKIMSELQLCETFKVSRPTVRKALKDLIEEGALIVRPGIGTFINPGQNRLAAASDFDVQTWGLLSSSGRNVHWDYLFMKFLATMLENISNLPVKVCPIELANNDARIVNEIRNFRLNGLIVFKAPDKLTRHLKKLEKEIDIIAYRGDCDISWKKEIVTDFVDYGKTAVEYLIGKGHKKIIFINPSPENIWVKSAVKGFEACMKKHRLSFDKHFLLWDEDYQIKIKTFIELGVEFSAVITVPEHYANIVRILAEHKMKNVQILTERSPFFSFAGNLETAFIDRNTGKCGITAAEIIKEIVSGGKPGKISIKIPWNIIN